MAQEIELKVAVASHSAVIDALRAAGAEEGGTCLQTDRFFDTADRSLLRGDRGLRMRRTEVLADAPGGQAEAATLVTFKGPRRSPEGLKVRSEHETAVEDGQTLARIFEACGLEPMVTIQKRRSTWRLGGCAVELDELPVIGLFVEIEGPDEAAVEAVRERLNLTGEPITDSYVALIAARLAPLPAGAEVTFENAAAWQDAPQ
jgi:adenylate cyclase class 2